MDLKALKSKLDTLQQKTPAGGQKRDYSLTFWRPTVGKQQIRIVPSAHNPKNPFTELKFYYGITNKVMVSPLNFGEKDPIALFAKKLREEYTKENYLLAKKLDGRDLTIETVGPESTGTQYNKSSVRVRLKESPLSADAAQVEKWKKDQPDPTSEFKRFTFDEMKSALEKWLSPEDQEGEIISEPASNFESDAPKSNFSLDTSNVKKNKADQFDSLFDGEGKKDDLPF